ncbi:MAG: type II secretion system F family protein, partial [Actinobacteria bacterium]|nr:type II secretion system F family protein [Actinomycetota bacterium]
HGPVAAVLGGLVLRVMPAKTRENLARRLLSAGLANRVSPETVLAAKAVIGGLGLLAGFVLGSKAAVATGVLLGLCFGFLGFLALDVFVNGRIRDRRERVLAALPDALDLLAVSVEAGLGFDGAVAKLVEYMDGPLIEEFALTLNEMRIGESRSEALKRMAGRVDVPELGSFIRAVVQADQLGTSIAGILRVQAADARLRRQFAAEEKAMKAPIKMLVPTALFIFPALFIVILGPILMNFRRNL